MLGNLNSKISIPFNSQFLPKYFFLNILIFSLFFSCFNSQSFDLQEANFENFKRRTNSFMFTICKFTDTRCKNLKKLYDEAAKNLKEKFNLEFKFPFVDPEKISIRISSEYPFEGSISSYYVNQQDQEKELYISKREIKPLMNFLEYRLIFPEENLKEARDEKELNEFLLKIPEQKALILMGDIANFSNINFRLLQLASRKAGVENIIQIRNEKFLEENFINDYELALINPDYEKEEKQQNKENEGEGMGNSSSSLKNERFTFLKFTKTQELEKDHISDLIKLALFNRKKENLFSEYSLNSQSLALDQGIPTITYFYSKKDLHLNEEFDNSMKILAQDYKDEVIINKGSINNNIIKELKIARHYNLTRDDLPLIMFTKRPERIFNSPKYYGFSDFFDVEKFFLKKSDLLKFVQTNLKDYLSSKLIGENELEFSAEIIEKFYEMCKNNLIEKEKVTTDQNRIEMNGHNFVQVINEVLTEGVKGVLIMICPRASKKFKRIRHRVERVFAKFYKPNDEKIIFDEFDPFMDEMSFINVKFYPAIVMVQKTIEEKKWKVTNFKGHFTTREISRFVKNTLEGTIMEADLDNEKEVVEFERENKLFPLSRLRYENKLLKMGRMPQSYNIGLKRRWNNLKNLGVLNIVNGKEFKEDYEVNEFNEFEMDDLSDEFENEDDVDESVLQTKDDKEKKDDSNNLNVNADDLKLDEAKMDL